MRGLPIYFRDDAETNAVTVKVNSLDEIPPAILKFAKEHDLPIFLQGE
jgi:hypothetical protein